MNQGSISSSGALLFASGSVAVICGTTVGFCGAGTPFSPVQEVSEQEISERSSSPATEGKGWIRERRDRLDCKNPPDTGVARAEVVIATPFHRMPLFHEYRRRVDGLNIQRVHHPQGRCGSSPVDRDRLHGIGDDVSLGGDPVQADMYVTGSSMENSETTCQPSSSPASLWSMIFQVKRVGSPLPRTRMAV